MGHRAIWYKFTDISEELTGSIFGVEEKFQQVNNQQMFYSWLQDFNPEYGDHTFIKTPVNSNQTSRHHIPYDCTLLIHHRPNLKSNFVFIE
jgi:hypothetical protein